MPTFLRFAPLASLLAVWSWMPQGALACSPLPDAELIPVAHARPAGPFVFLLLCHGETSACSDETPALRVTQSGPQGGEVAGTASFLDFSLDRSSYQRLIAFTPHAPLDTDATYQAQIVDGSTWDAWTHVRVGPAGPANPLATVVAHETWDSVSRGTRYSCPEDVREWIDDTCGDYRSGFATDYVSWSQETHTVGYMNVALSPQDGWLFAVFSSPDIVNKLRVMPSAKTSEKIEPGMQRCLTAFAYNVYDGSELTREMCLTGSEPPSDPVQNEPPALGTCKEPPKADGLVVDEFVSRWCRERAPVCKADAESESPARECSTFHETCEDFYCGVTSDDDDGRDVGASDDEYGAGVESGGPGSKNGPLGCSVAAPSPQRGAGWWWFAGMAGLAARTRRRGRC